MASGTIGGLPLPPIKKFKDLTRLAVIDLVTSLYASKIDFFFFTAALFCKHFISLSSLAHFFQSGDMLLINWMLDMMKLSFATHAEAITSERNSRKSFLTDPRCSIQSFDSCGVPNDHTLETLGRVFSEAPRIGVQSVVVPWNGLVLILVEIKETNAHAAVFIYLLELWSSLQASIRANIPGEYEMPPKVMATMPGAIEAGGCKHDGGFAVADLKHAKL